MRSKFRPVAELHEELFGNRPGNVTVSRWCNIGRRGKTLPVVRARGRLLTTEEDLLEFLRHEPACDLAPTERPVTTARDAKQKADAEAELDKLGIG